MATSHNIPNVQYIPTGWGAPRYKVEGVETEVVILLPHLRKLRAYSGATVKDMAAVIGIPWRTMAGYFAGHDPSIKVAPLMERLFAWGRAQEVKRAQAKPLQVNAPTPSGARSEEPKTTPKKAAKKATATAPKVERYRKATKDFKPEVFVQLGKQKTQSDAIVPRGTRKTTQANAKKGGKAK